MNNDILHDRSLRFKGNNEDHEIFGNLSQTAYPKIYRVVRGLSHNVADAEGMTQEAFLRAFRFRGKFRGEAKPLTWLTRIAINAAFKGNQKNAPYKKALSLEKLPKKILAGPNQHQAIQAVELNNLLCTITAEEQQLIFLKEIEGCSTKELSQRTGLNGNTVRTKVFRAMQKLIEVSQRADFIAAARKASYPHLAKACDGPQRRKAVRRVVPPSGHTVR